MVGNNTTLFFVRDPMKFQQFIRSQIWHWSTPALFDTNRLRCVALIDTVRNKKRKNHCPLMPA